jgi:23S rRNA (uracil1939-C5)-methyltransferase
MTKVHHFQIEDLDFMGQGVSKTEGIVTFIPKTLPGESGQAKILKKQSKIQWGRISGPDDIAQKSPLRGKPECVHYDVCPGCHYQHTDYQAEIVFKARALQQHLIRGAGLRYLDEEKIIIHPAETRYHHRNRVQLHYRLDHKQLGLVDAFTNQIIPIPHCLLGELPICQTTEELYQHHAWKDLALDRSSGERQGHIEIELLPSGKTEIRVNRPYAAKGFSQVNTAMNRKLTDYLSTLALRWRDQFPTSSTILDLFGGNGNLSRSFQGRRRVVVDTAPPPDEVPAGSEFLSLNLERPEALEILSQKFKSVDLLLLDPPRRGFKDLEAFTQIFRPARLIYVSCSPDTLARDLRAIMPFFELQEIHLFDFFPATYHFETLVILQQKDGNDFA